MRRHAHRPLREDALAVAEAAVAEADAVGDAVAEPPPKKKKKSGSPPTRTKRRKGAFERPKGPASNARHILLFLSSALFLSAFRPDFKYFTE